MERALRTNLTLLRYASAIMEQKKCWELLPQKFDRFQTTTPNNTHQHATGCANGRNTQHPTMLRPFAWGLKAQLCSHCGWLLLKSSTVGIGFNGAETNC